MKLAFTVEYDGTNFSGFQNQKNAPSIQQAIEKALKEITQTNISINYAGRTDAGVHALCQVFDFETDIERDDTNWLVHSLVWLDNKGEVKLGNRPVHMNTLTNQVKFIPPKKRVY